MSIRKEIAAALFLSSILAGTAMNAARAGAREEGRLLTATEVLEEVQAMPDQRIPDALLSRAYGIAVIPDVTKVAFIFGGRHGNGVLVVRDKLNSPWSNPTFVALTGGSWGFQAGAQSSDIILVFTTKAGVEGQSRIRIQTPLLKMTKAEIIRAGLKLGLDYGLTWSCYDPLADGRACRRCDSCQLRLKGFEEAGAVDPIQYAE